MLIAVIVEGDSDRGFIEGIVEKLRIRNRVYIALMRGNRPKKVKGMLEALEVRGIRIAIVLKDLHRGVSQKLIDMLKNTLKELRERGLDAELITLRCCIEEWIIEGLCIEGKGEDPVEDLKGYLRGIGGYFVKTYGFYRDLAGRVDLNKIRSENFKRFISLLSS